VFELGSSRWNLILPLVILALVGVLISGCLGGGGDNDKEISISGSTTVFPIVDEASKAFMDDHSSVHIIVTSGGSGKGVKDVGLGTSDIGMASRNLKDSEIDDYPDLKTHKIANDGLSIIVHEDNPITDLTMDQLRSIYAGEIDNWKDLGGDDHPIILVGRDEISGTRATFDEMVMGDKALSSGMSQEESNDKVHDKVMVNKHGIGYVGHGFLGDGVKVIDLDGITPTIETVQDGTYPISRPLNVVTDGEPGGAVKDFIDFLKSEDGQKIVEEQGFIPLV
jgi:phosphate transport system substrate-binding protein